MTAEDHIRARDAGTSVFALAAGSNHTCALISAAEDIACWGSNEYGQVGDGCDWSSCYTPVLVNLSSGIGCNLSYLCV